MKILIIGGVAAGTKTAAKLKREDRNIDVTVITKEKYSALTGVEVRTGKEAVALDAEKKQVTVQDVQTGEKEVCSYDRLVVAVGASPAILPIEGKELAGVFKMRTPDDAEGIRTYAEQNNVKKAVVIGAGFIGLEAAENLQAKGIQVTVIDLRIRSCRIFLILRWRSMRKDI